MNASANRLTTIKAIGGRRTDAGHPSRQPFAQPGENDQDQAETIADPMANRTLVRMLILASTSSKAMPSTAQLVVISGR